MTKEDIKKDRRGERGARSMSVGQALFCVMSVLALLLTFRHSEEAISAMSAGMKLCASTVIPSLFPFMVISELVVSSGAADIVARALGGAFERVFGISRSGAVALVLGYLCGFPIGTKSALALYERGRISKSELEHLLSFCNNPSSAFLMSAVGVRLFGSYSFGVMLYCIHLISSVFLGICGRFYFNGSKREYYDGERRRGADAQRGIASIPKAITDSAESMLYICSFVIFFSALLGILSLYAEDYNLPSFITALLFGFLEMTGGVAKASALPLGVALPVVAAITGWSGLSVHFQMISICREHKISFRPYFLCKLACAMLNTLLLAAGMRIFGQSMTFSPESASSSIISGTLYPWKMAVGVFFAISLMAFARSVLKRKRG